ncbi:MAG: hypothetical protein ACPLPR_01255 [Bacillota bacterium]
MGLREVYGPFCGSRDGVLAFRRMSRPPDPCFVVRAEAQAHLLELAGKLKFFTRRQAVRVLGPCAGKHLRVLHGAGYLDVLETGRTPPVYMPGPGVLEVLGVEARGCRMPHILRTVAANQLYAVLGGAVEYEATGEDWPTAVLGAGERTYLVLAPRLWPEEDVWLDWAVSGLDPEARVIVVAPSETGAMEAAQTCAARGVTARYTWDAELKDGFALFRYTSLGFARDDEAAGYFGAALRSAGSAAGAAAAYTGL